jgi:AraC family transcriptional regulator, exoenzyme S synthesis regulatory protein ExsA
MYNLPGDLPVDKKNDIILFDYNLSNQIDKHKVLLEKNLFSFLLEGHKQVHFANTTVTIRNNASLLMSSGNCLVTEELTGAANYRCIMLFFSQQKMMQLLLKHPGLSVKTSPKQKKNTAPYFLIEKDVFIEHFIQSLLPHFAMPAPVSQKILELKLEEIVLYMAEKYGSRFNRFLQTMLQENAGQSLKETVEANTYSNLSIEQIAFLCNMSLSSFKRHFADVYNQTPGNWFKQKRLARAKELLQSGTAKPSEIFVATGYKNLAHFSTAYKARFGKSPKHSFAN